MRRRRGGREPSWARWSDARLLDLRLCDLDVGIEGTVLEDRIESLHEEVQLRGLAFRPHYWLSSEWFSPDGTPGIAIPFYLAHPRLMRLEHSQMLEVEGGSRRWCLRILRHEYGHAIDTAYRLHRRRKWRALFGLASTPYPDQYQPRPYSRSYVRHLEAWYAQSHPSEDFAETFAVWLAPGSRWRTRYAGWAALKKLRYVDELMAEVKGMRPAVRDRSEVEPLRSLRMTLKEHYDWKRSHYAQPQPAIYDPDLRKLFVTARASPDGESAAAFLARLSPDVRRTVAYWTGQYQYNIDQVLKTMIDRSRALKLRLAKPEEQARSEALLMVTVQVMNYLHRGHHKVAV